MTKFRKLLGLLPFLLAFFLCDKTPHDYLVSLVGGIVLWIPYWFVWWFSDGFDTSNFSGEYPQNDFPDHTRDFRGGPEGYGRYVGDQCIHH